VSNQQDESSVGIRRECTLGNFDTEMSLSKLGDFFKNHDDANAFRTLNVAAQISEATFRALNVAAQISETTFRTLNDAAQISEATFRTLNDAAQISEATFGLYMMPLDLARRYLRIEKVAIIQ
jgi:hypothetical protein